LLHYFEGHSVQEIAERLGCERETVLSRLSRARSRLKQLLEAKNLATSVVRCRRAGFPGGKPADPASSG
jgi:hypothetical protein